MKKLITIVVLCTTIITSKLFAQNTEQEFSDRMNHIFEHVCDFFHIFVV
jgi:hypothetical protein